MALSVTEACAVNVLLRYLYGPPAVGSYLAEHDPIPTLGEVEAAARDLAHGASRKLMAGYRPEQLVDRPLRVVAR